MTLFDTHAHFDSFAAEGGVDQVLARAAAAGVARICAVGSSEASNDLVARLAQEHPAQLVAAVGYDRDQVDKPCDVAKLSALADGPGVVAVGETGLDYYYSADTAPDQRRLFARMLEFALDRRLPVVVHSRYADDETLDLLGEFSTAWKKVFHSMEKKTERFPQHGKTEADFSTAWKPPPDLFHSVEKEVPPPGILHCFTGDMAFAEALLAMGFMISFSGIVSFNNAGPLREVARHMPLDRLLVETDCPYLTPKPFRGKVNEPAFVVRVAEVVAEARDSDAIDIAAATFANALRVFQREGEP